MDFFSLLYLIFSPLLAAIIIACPKFPNNTVIIRRFAKCFAGLHLIYSLLFLLMFDSTSFSPSFASELTFFKRSWIQTLGIKASFAMDGISLAFVILTSFITLIALFASKNKITYSHKLYYSLFFTAQTSILGLLCAQDMFTFFFFLELSLIPFYFLISHWSANEDEKMSRKFLGFNILGGFFILTPMLILYFYNFAITGTLSASIETLNFDNFEYPGLFQLFIFSSFLMGFLIRTGIFPFHNWIIECVDTAKIPVSMLLLSSFATSGLYGIFRFNMSAFPETFAMLAYFIFILGIIGIIYIAFLLTTEQNLKKIFGFFAIIQNCLIILALSSLNSLSYIGAILLCLSSSITICGLLTLAQIIERRTKTYKLPFSYSLSESMPKFKIFAYFIFFAAILTPFLFGFCSMLLTVFGSTINDFGLSFIAKILSFSAILMLIIVYIYLISVFHKMIFSNQNKETLKIRDICLTEMTMLSFITCALLFFGIYPMSIVNIVNATSHFAINIFRI